MLERTELGSEGAGSQRVAGGASSTHASQPARPPSTSCRATCSPAQLSLERKHSREGGVLGGAAFLPAELSSSLSWLRLP